MKHFGPFRLDTVNQCLWRDQDTGGKERLLLPPKAFAVLSYLLEHPGRLVTHDELLHTVWSDVVVQPEVLKSQILAVRRALGDDPKRPRFVETLPRRGYRFIAPLSQPMPQEPQRSADQLVGRSATLFELQERLRAVSIGKRQIIFLTGEAGIGKTAVIDEFERQTTNALPNARIARGQCVEGYGGKEPFYPMLEALGELLHGPSQLELIDLLASRAPTWLAQFPALLTRRHREMLQREILGSTRERMLREVGEVLETLASADPLVILFEDLHWVDPATVDFISALARRRSPARLMLLGSYRSDDMSPNDPLKTLARDLRIHKLCETIDLPPLAKDDIKTYLAGGTATSDQADGLARLIHRHTDGNPLFMVAAMEHMTRRGLVSRETDGWRIVAPLSEIELGIPDTLRQMIEALIERLSQEERRALEAASVVGEAFGVDICAALTNREPYDLENLFEELSRRRHIVASSERRHSLTAINFQDYEFRHALYRETFYRRMPDARRERMHLRIAEFLEAQCASDVDEIAHQLAHHFEHASEWARAIHYLHIAADLAARRYAPREAPPILQRALELARHLAEPQRLATELETLERLAINYAAATDPRVLETYRDLIARAAQAGQIDLQIRGLLGLASPLSWIDTRGCLEVLDRALQLSSEQNDSVLRARTRVSCFAWRVWAGGWTRADAQKCRDALREIRLTCDSAVLAPHLVDYSLIPLFSSEYREAVATLHEARASLREASGNNPYANIPYQTTQFLLPMCLTYLGEWGEALRDLDSEISMLDKNGDYYRAQGLRLQRATVHLHAMDFLGAREICESAVPLLRDPAPRADPASPNPYPLELRMTLILSSHADIGLGNHQRALDSLSAAKRDMQGVLAMFDWYWHMVLESGFAELWLAMENLECARSAIARFFEVTQSTEERTWQALAFEVDTRLALAESDLQRAGDRIKKAARIVDRLEVPLAAWRVHATAARVFALQGRTALAEDHRRLSRATVRALANSLPGDSALRRIFLAAPAISHINAGG